MAIAIENSLKNLLGVVLCGGKSVRMGTDKGLLIKEGKIWASIVAQKFDALSMPYVVSVNQSQTDNYTAFFSQNNLIVDEQIVPGPLRGLLTVHQQYPQKNLLVLACDMIDMQLETVESLVTNYITQPNFNFYAYHNGDFWEPFCGIYSAKGLNSIILANETDFSLQHFLTSGPTQKNIILDMASFKNYNSV